jgi:flagellum-specific peptidoglycan hydrolase FlgJ
MERTKWGRRKLKKKSRKTEKLKKNLFGVAYKTETELKSVWTIPFDSLLHHI